MHHAREGIMVNELLALFNEGRNLQYILDSMVAMLREHAGCEAVAVRIKDEHGNIPYHAHVGFPADFIAKENNICVRHDKCACIYVTQGDYDPTLPVFTNTGSFHSPHLQNLTLLKEGMKDGRFRGECVLRGWETLALVPVRFAHRYFGLIQIVDSRRDALTPEKAEMVEAVAGQLGLYMHAIQANRDRENEMAYLIRRIMHDLKLPLSTITMYSDLILAEHANTIDSDVTDSVNRIINNAGYMSRLVSSLNMFSDSIAVAETHIEDIPLDALLADMVKDLKAMKYPDVKIKLQPDMPAVRYPILHLRRVLSNLISNAIKFSATSSSPLVEVGCVEKDTFYQVYVSDNGIGMDDADVEKVFLPFYRTDGAKGIPGTGLGLSICKKIVESNGGEIWVYSTQGEGSTFYFTIPK